ncbi:divergent polysaccharide deacetylase family protein [Tritonibacter horizontis]|uniref:Divergent polysaccharide deacetylase n=1 Tax=Tritonibacter horizontis TaxID=1768241 RepID=A0A132BR81_9RHOB|nr:divergent polysaccharide deacetylase family protein [Tritonibacter horizontis]KUP90908.1 divergent polysaccharide deacetylase [Tritonibacter horizontis]
MRGFLGGVSTGALVAMAGAAIWSLSAPLPRPIDVSGDTPAPILAPRENSALPQDRPGADSDVVEVAPVAPQDHAGADDGSPEDIDQDAPDRPEVTTAVSDVDSARTTAALETSDIAPEIRAGTDTPVAPVPQESGETLVAPGAETLPEAPAASVAAPQAATDVAPGMQAPDTGSDVAAVTDQATQDSETDAASDAEGTTPQPQAPVVLNPDLGAPPDTTLPPSIALPAPTPEVQSDRAQSDVAEPEPGSDERTQRIADLPQANSNPAGDGPRVGTRVVPLTERDTPGTDQPEADDLTPFARNSEPVGALTDLPMMSIVLIEEEGAVGAEALADFPYPLAFAIDPSDPKAVERMAARRAAGFEVMILADLPREASPQDAETALPIWFDRLPGALGVLEGIDTGVQGNRPLADQVATIVQDAGYGLVLQDNGLNTVQKMALREGVPAGVVFRDFDGAGQDPRAMRRFLDQAAFRAGQEGGVVMLGRLKPDTISALLVWGLQDRASTVALVPVSATLKRLLDPLDN